MTGTSTAAIVGPGNMGANLLAKLRRLDAVDVAYMVGVVESEGVARARKLGVAASADGVDWLLGQDPLPRSCSRRPRRGRTWPTRRATPRRGSRRST